MEPCARGAFAAWMIKFLFVHSWNGFSLAEWYLRTTLEERFGKAVKVRSLDLPSNNIPINNNLPNILSLWQPDIIGFSCHYWSLPLFLDACKWVRHLCPKAITLLGGPQVNDKDTAAGILERNDSIDAIIRGPGENSLSRLIETRADRMQWVSIRGLSTSINGAIYHSEEADSAVTPGEIFHAQNHELIAQITHLHEVSYATLRGCRSRCSYCVYPSTPLRLREDAMVLRELDWLCSCGIENIRICDSHFGGNQKRAKMILKHLARCNRRSKIHIYPDLKSVDKEYIKLVKDANAIIISIGVQTTDPFVLASINRENAFDSQEAIQRILQAFPETPCDLIVGLPADSVETFEQSCRDVLDMGFSSVNVFPLMSFPGTPLSQQWSFRKKAVFTLCGQLLSSPDFPVKAQKRLAHLSNAVQIAGRLPATKHLLQTLGKKPSSTIDVLMSLPGDALSDFREAFSYGKNPVYSNESTLVQELGKLSRKNPGLVKALQKDLKEGQLVAFTKGMDR